MAENEQIVDLTDEEMSVGTADVSDQVYDESQIQVLEGLEAVRKRPGMYIGTTSVRGLHHLVYEIVDNSIDEAMAGRCDKITVVLYPDGSVSVEDNGRGVPAEMHHKMNKPAMEVVFSVLHAGGKFGGSGYKIAGGLHGVGASVVNALSEWFEVDNCYEGKRYTMRFERGAVARPFECVGDAGERHGLFVRFKPDAEIFTDTTEFDITMLLTRLREQAFLNAGIRIIIRDEREKITSATDGELDEDIKRMLAAAEATDVPAAPEEDDEYDDFGVKTAEEKSVEKMDDLKTPFCSIVSTDRPGIWMEYALKLPIGEHSERPGRNAGRIIRFCDYASAGGEWSGDNYFTAFLQLDYGALW